MPPARRTSPRCIAASRRRSWRSFAIRDRRPAVPRIGIPLRRERRQTAERQCGFFVDAGIDPADLLPWNAYHWYLNAPPTSGQFGAGVEPLRRLIELMPGLRGVLLLGKDAQARWPLFLARHCGTVQRRGIETLAIYHPGRQALQHTATRRSDKDGGAHPVDATACGRPPLILT